MKKILATLGQISLFFLFYGIFFAGSLLAVLKKDPFGAPQWFAQSTATTSSWFVPTGFILMTILYLLILLAEILAKRLRTAGLWTTTAYILALFLGFLSKFGQVHINRY